MKWFGFQLGEIRHVEIQSKHLLSNCSLPRPPPPSSKCVNEIARLPNKLAGVGRGMEPEMEFMHLTFQERQQHSLLLETILEIKVLVNSTIFFLVFCCCFRRKGCHKQWFWLLHVGSYCVNFLSCDIHLAAQDGKSLRKEFM